jgi:hypothetical protein
MYAKSQFGALCRNGKDPLLTQRIFPQKGLGKKRGRKRIYGRERQRLTASAAFLTIRLPADFERRITNLKTNIDIFMNAVF